MKTISAIILFTLLGISFWSCSPASSITSSYVDKEGVQPSSLSKMLILALTDDKNRSVQQSLENQFVKELRARGYEVESSFQEFGPRAFQGMTEAEAVRKLAEDGINGVLTVSLLNKEQEQNYNPGRTRLGAPFITRNWWGYYNVYYPRIYEPGYYTNSTNYFLETNLYSAGKDKLLYSAQSKTFDPGSAEGLAVSVSRAVVRDMVQKGILRP